MTEIQSMNMHTSLLISQKPHFKDYPDVLTVQEAAELLRACCSFSDAPVQRPAFIKAII